MTATPTETNAAGTLSFEMAMSELEALIERMDRGQLPLEESLAAYQRGHQLLLRCEALLADAEERVRVLEDGQLKAREDLARGSA